MTINEIIGVIGILILFFGLIKVIRSTTHPCIKDDCGK